MREQRSFRRTDIWWIMQRLDGKWATLAPRYIAGRERTMRVWPTFELARAHVAAHGRRTPINGIRPEPRHPDELRAPQAPNLGHGHR